MQCAPSLGWFKAVAAVTTHSLSGPASPAFPNTLTDNSHLHPCLPAYTFSGGIGGGTAEDVAGSTGLGFVSATNATNWRHAHTNHRIAELASHKAHSNIINRYHQIDTDR